MSKQRMTIRTGILASLAVSFLIVSPALKATEDIDSEQVSKLLSDARTQAFQLKEDAATMESFARQDLSWESHTNTVSQIKEHINAVGRQLTQLDAARDSASFWQKTAIDRMKPLLQELASNTESVINYLNKNPKRLNATDYRDYLEANADQAAQLSSLIDDFVNYGKTKHRLDRLTNKLELTR